MEIAPTPEWEELRDALLREGGTTLLLGATDSGKSTLVRWLVGSLAAAGTAVALVDADVGQSALCLPGTVGMALFRTPHDVAEYRCGEFSFLGSANAARIIPALAGATGRLAARARHEAPALIIDTTGLIDGIPGVALKVGKIRETRPDRVVAIQHEGECEPILSHLGSTGVFRLLPSPHVTRRSPEARARRRRMRLAAYFARAPLTEALIHAGGAEFFRLGRRVDLPQGPPSRGAVIGLNRGDVTLALGIVTEADGESVAFSSHLVSPREVNGVVFGDITLTDEVD
ncbi:polynucleotide 5'-hydroxyl-kinase [Geobacter sp.]|uniref:Clp1/GlmU family protein n=2 Tax=Geobacteraceae TaxID=213422 RepID=UPI00260AD4EE|nr:polynucleotide 5'-hydroxyl-kinase [Geobacter sp.]